MYYTKLCSHRRAASKLIEEFGYPLKVEADSLNKALQILQNRCRTYQYSLGNLDIPCTIYYKAYNSIIRISGEADFYWDEYASKFEFRNPLLNTSIIGLSVYSYNPEGDSPIHRLIRCTTTET